MELPAKADSRDLDGAKEWSPTALFDVEQQRLTRWIGDEANDRLSGLRATKQTAMAAGASVQRQIELSFAQIEPNRDQRIMRDAGNGELRGKAGSPAIRRTVALFMFLALVCEVAFFVVLWSLGIGNPILILQGFMLAGGSYLAGQNLYDILEGIGAAKDRGVRRSAVRAWVLLIFGLLLISFVVYLRYDSSTRSDAIVVLTIALAVLGISLTCFHRVRHDRYLEALQQMQAAQRWIATDSHRRACEQNHWKQEYELAVQRLTTHDDPSVPPGQPEEAAR